MSSAFQWFGGQLVAVNSSSNIVMTPEGGLAIRMINKTGVHVISTRVGAGLAKVVLHFN